MSRTAETLAKVSEIWLDTSHPLREETVQALQVSTGLNPRQIERALTSCFEELTGEKINAYIAALDQVQRANVVEVGTRSPSQRGFVFHVLPSNVFTAWVHGVVTTLLFGLPCRLKPSVREPVFARAWKKSLEIADPSLGECVQISEWSTARLEGASAVVAYGADETLARLRTQVPPQIPFVGYGHKLSLAILFEEALSPEDATSLLSKVQSDVDPFRLQGCLSPQILYVQEDGFSRWPALEAVSDVAPKIRPFTVLEGVVSEVQRFRPYLSCVGIAGNPSRTHEVSRVLADHAGIRICAVGEMQRPPLSWKNGGVDLADLLHSI